MVASFATEGTYNPDTLLVGTREPVSRKITLAAGQNLPRGAVLGKVTASGAYVLSDASAADGSETPAVVLAEATDASGGDRDTVGYFAATVDENLLTFGTGHSAASTREALRDVGIYLQSSVT